MPMQDHFLIPVPVKGYIKAYMELAFMPEKRILSPSSSLPINNLIFCMMDNRSHPYRPARSEVLVNFFLSKEGAKQRKASSLGERGRKMAEGEMNSMFKKATYDHVLASMMDGSNKNEGLITFRERYAIYEDTYSFKSHLQALDRYSEPLPMKLNTSLRKERLDRMYWEVRYHMMASKDTRLTMRDHIRDFYTKNPDMKEIMTQNRAWSFIKQFKQIRNILEPQPTQEKRV
jgi:hypothetical protein